MNRSPNYLILGGGIAGLTAGLELSKRGRNVAIIEKNDGVGGLAQTIHRDGFRFDLGGHRFHSNNSTVVGWVSALLGNDLLRVPRRSRIYMGTRFFDYPLQLSSILGAFPLFESLHMGASFFRSALSEFAGPDISFEDWVVRRFGYRIYDIFFRPYTEKVWGIPCDQLSADWASQRIGIPNFWQALKSSILPEKLFPPTAISSFYYPKQGFGMLPDAIAHEFLASGGEIHTGTTLRKLLPVGSGFQATVQKNSGETIHFDAENVVSTLPLPSLLYALPKATGSRQIAEDNPVSYRSLICVMLAVNKARVSPDHWTYFPGKEFIFGRTHEPKNWSPEMVPHPGVTSLCVEVFTGREEATWGKSDAVLASEVISGLQQAGWLRAREVEKHWVVKVPFAYPMYTLGYREKIKNTREFLSRWENLHLIGRTGSFQYMNSDGVLENVFEFIANQQAGSPVKIQPLLKDTGRWV